ncbi:MAG: hypothetical protein IJS69_02340 [Selenomonadaceae bacterium]|nr:hypothetical protein [Selenomonadaceae bacterium]
MKKTDFGLVYVEYATIKRIAERALSQVKGINEAQLSIEKLSNSVTPIKIRLELSLAEGYSVVKIKEAVDKAINDELRDQLRLEFYVPIDASVEQIKKPAQEQRRRVR